MATLDSSQTWTYKEMAAALREKLPETKTQAVSVALMAVWESGWLKGVLFAFPARSLSSSSGRKPSPLV